MRLAPRRWPNGDEIEPFDVIDSDALLYVSDDVSGYQELRERADDRLRDANSPAQVLKALKLQVYIQNRAYRELGSIV